MTLYQLIEILKKISKTQPNVRTTTEGDVYRCMNNNPAIDYDVVHISQGTHQHLEYLDRYNLVIFFISRLKDDLESNRIQSQSIGKEVLNNIITDFCNAYDLDYPTYTIQCFTEKFVDLCAGCYVTLTFEIPTDACADDFSEILSVYQTKTIDITENGQYTVTPDSNYDALEKVIINVDVPCSGSSYEEGFADGYDSGYTDGYQDGLADCGSDYDQGFEDGVAEQKSKLIATAFTENGTYTREDGFNTVTVSVSQTGYTQEDLDDAYNRGYLDGLDDCGSTDTGDYLTIEALENGNLYWSATGTTADTKTIEYSKNNGQWQSVRSSSGGTLICSVETGDLVRFRGTNDTYCFVTDNLLGTINGFQSTCTYKVYGNIMSLHYGDDFADKKVFKTEHTTFRGLFMNSEKLVDASKLVLPATELRDYCYSFMFYSCTNLVSAPALPATTVVHSCYASMFAYCTKLATAPELPATTLADSCYYQMFVNCSSLTTPPSLSVTTLANYCYYGMFQNCINLITAPYLLAESLVDSCYQYMFSGCTSIRYIKCLATDISARNCVLGWTKNVGYTGFFVKKTSMQDWTRGVDIPDTWEIKNED